MLYVFTIFMLLAETKSSLRSDLTVCSYEFLLRFSKIVFIVHSNNGCIYIITPGLMRPVIRIGIIFTD